VKKLRRILPKDKKTTSWCLYDVGNSAFATTIMATILPVYFKEIATPFLKGNLSTVYWGYASALALLCSAIVAPLLGAIGDISQKKKKMLGLFTLLGIISTAALFFVQHGHWKAALFFMVLGTIGFSASMIFYDSLLPHIVPLNEIDMVSSQGYALGYLGGGILLAINLVMISIFPGTLGPRLSFLSVALWWGLFSIPLFIFVPEPYAKPLINRRHKWIAGEAWLRLRQTFSEIRKYRDLFRFLIAFWFYNDGIGTMIRMAAIYGANVGISKLHLVGALLMTQFIGVPFSLFFGQFASKVGSKKAILTGLSGYVLISIGALFLSKAWHFWLLALAVGTVQGGTQAISRSLYASLVPPSRSAEFFGFYDISSKFAGVMGPALFGFITHITGSSRMGIAVISTTFIIGAIILFGVNVMRGIKNASLQNSL
jgi:UMF1 family MFS transporter